LAVEDHLANTKVICAKCNRHLLVPSTAPSNPPASPKKSAPDVKLAKPAGPKAPSSVPKDAVPRATPPAQPLTPVAGAAASSGQYRKPRWVPWLVAASVAVFLLAASAAIAIGVWLVSPSSTNKADTFAVASIDEPKPPDPQPPGPDKQPAKSNQPAPSAENSNPPASRTAAYPEKTELPAKLTGTQVYERVLKSTVWINNPEMGFGTGVLINAKERTVLTNYHVICRNPALQSARFLKPLGPPIEDKLTNKDPQGPDSKRFKAYSFHFLQANEYQIDMVSIQVDSFLMIIDPARQVVAFDDDSGGNQNARIRFKPPQDGDYQVIATTFEGGVGSFRLVVAEVDARKEQLLLPNQKVAAAVTVHFPDFADGRVIADKAHYDKLSLGEPAKGKAEVLAWSESKDLAILKLSQVPEGVPPLPLAKESSRPGDAVHSIGNPGRSGAMWVYTSGTVRTAPYQKKWQSLGAWGLTNRDAWVIETQSPTNPGDSGGPLANEAGELVGVTQGVGFGANSINLFIDVGEVRAFLKSQKVDWVGK